MPTGAMIFIAFSLSFVTLFYLFLGAHIRYATLKMYSHQGTILFLNLLNMKSRNAILESALKGEEITHKARRFRDRFAWVTPYVDGKKPWPEHPAWDFCALVIKQSIKTDNTPLTSEKLFVLWDEISDDLPEDAAKCFDELMLNLILGTLSMSFSAFLYFYAYAISKAIITLNTKLLGMLIVFSADGIKSLLGKTDEYHFASALDMIQRNKERFA